MLIAFSVKNFRSFRDQQTLSLLASGGSDLRQNLIESSDVAALEGQRVLKAAAVYGANASGKSNFVRALDALTRMVAYSAKESTQSDEFPITPFLLDASTPSEPTEFSVTFVLADVLYEYRLSVTRKRVEREELIAFPKKMPQHLFVRSRDDKGQQQWHFSRTHFRRDKELEGRTRDNSLYLSVCAQFNHALLADIYKFFASIDFRIPRRADVEETFTAETCVTNEDFRTWVAEVLCRLDTGIESLEAERRDLSAEIPAKIRKMLTADMIDGMRKHATVQTVRKIPGTDVSVKWDLSAESDGTRQLFSLLRSWYQLIREGRIIIVDELDASLHSLLSRKLLEFIADPRYNPNAGQLIFTTHDTSLLDLSLLRRDQIFFVERMRSGASQLYSLLEYAPRKDEALQKGYLAGRYGAVPFLGDLHLAQDTGE